MALFQRRGVCNDVVEVPPSLVAQDRLTNGAEYEVTLLTTRHAEMRPDEGQFRGMKSGSERRLSGRCGSLCRRPDRSLIGTAGAASDPWRMVQSLRAAGVDETGPTRSKESGLARFLWREEHVPYRTATTPESGPSARSVVGWVRDSVRTRLPWSRTQTENRACDMVVEPIAPSRRNSGSPVDSPLEGDGFEPTVPRGNYATDAS